MRNKNIFTIPNILSMFRLLLLPVIVYMYAQFKKIVALSNLIQRIYHNDIRNMLP